jgi:hypothetical protein
MTGVFTRPFSNVPYYCFMVERNGKTSLRRDAEVQGTRIDLLLPACLISRSFWLLVT